MGGVFWKDKWKDFGIDPTFAGGAPHSEAGVLAVEESSQKTVKLPVVSATPVDDRIEPFFLRWIC